VGTRLRPGLPLLLCRGAGPTWTLSNPSSSATIRPATAPSNATSPNGNPPTVEVARPTRPAQANLNPALPSDRRPNRLPGYNHRRPGETSPESGDTTDQGGLRVSPAMSGLGCPPAGPLFVPLKAVPEGQMLRRAAFSTRRRPSPRGTAAAGARCPLRGASRANDGSPRGDTPGTASRTPNSPAGSPERGR